MSTLAGLSRDEILATLKDARARAQVDEDREVLAGSLSKFIKAGWHVLKPQERYIHNWHIDAMSEKLEAVSAGEIKRLQVWVPPQSMKSMEVSVAWPAWEWATNPWLRYWGASYEVGLAGRLAAMSRDWMMSAWYQARWGDRFEFTREADRVFGNNRGGTRLATAPNSTGSGEHGHRILIDDPINAKAADATSRVVLDATNNWYDGTVVTRGIGNDHARVIVMQRLHEDDLAGHVLELEEWDVLCLPERYEPKHQFAWPDDPRTEDGELLWPEARDEKSSTALAKSLTTHRAAGQLQQRPSSPDGEILKKTDWRFYDSRIRSEERWAELPKFTMVIQTVDTPLKDRESNDNCAVQVWGIHRADAYLLDLRLGKMGYPVAKRTVKEMALWARRAWPKSRHFLLIENAGYGSEMIVDLKRELTGVTKLSQGSDGDKVMRATTASDALESHNCFLPGFGPPWQPTYEEARTPEDVVKFVANAAAFPNAAHDDDVDAWANMVNWKRAKTTTPMRVFSAHRGR